MEFLGEIALFLGQALSLVVALLLLALGLMAIAQRRQRSAAQGHIEVDKLNEQFRYNAETLAEALDPEATKTAAKARRKAEKAAAKARRKAAKRSRDADRSTAERERPVTFVLDFDGDMQASGADALREEISAILSARRDGDDVLLRLESPGGIVPGYGLAASQLQRLRDAGMPLTACVDKVAASGGYMMACVAEQIVAAPFAVVGSIGVVAQLPNFHRFLKKHDVDVELLTAGEYKRTLTIFGENTDRGRQKFREELDETHALFKAFVHDNRPALDLDTVATGEIWYGRQAVEVGLIDRISTSDGLLQSLAEARDLLSVRYVRRQSWQEKLGVAAEESLSRALLRLWQRSLNRDRV